MLRAVLHAWTIIPLILLSTIMSHIISSVLIGRCGLNNIVITLVGRSKYSQSSAILYIHLIKSDQIWKPYDRNQEYDILTA